MVLNPKTPFQNILATGWPIAGGRFPFSVWMKRSQNSEGIQPSFVVEEVELIRKPGIALVSAPEMPFWSEAKRLKHPGDFFPKQLFAQNPLLKK